MLPRADSARQTARRVRQPGHLEIVRGEKGERAVFRCQPGGTGLGQGKAIVGAGATADFVHQDETVRGGIVQDIRCLAHFDHEGGAATLYANDALSGLTRLNSLITRNKSAPADIDALIGEVVHLVVHILRTPTGRRIQEIIEVDGHRRGSYRIKKF